MSFFSKKSDVQVISYYPDCQKSYSEAAYVYNKKHDYERKQLFIDVIKIGLGGLVSVGEVLDAATAVMDAYDREFGDKEQQELEEFFASPNEPAAAFPEV